MNYFPHYKLLSLLAGCSRRHIGAEWRAGASSSKSRTSEGKMASADMCLPIRTFNSSEIRKGIMETGQPDGSEQEARGGRGVSSHLEARRI